MKKILFCFMLLMMLSPMAVMGQDGLEQRANNGDAEAQLSLGYMYTVCEDFNEAVKWFTKAAEQGNAEAQFALGCCYYTGKGATQDTKKGLELIINAAEQGNKEAIEFLEENQ